MIVLCSLLTMMVAGCGTTQQSQVAPKPETVDTSENEADVSKNEENTADQGIQSFSDLFGNTEDVTTLTFGDYGDKDDGSKDMIPYYTLSGLPSNGNIDKDQYWLYGTEYGDLKTHGSDDTINNLQELSQIDGAVWDLKFYLPIDQGTTYVTATCIEDWDLAKSSSADERNYTEGTYKEFEYFTYDGVEPAFEGDTVDNSIYLYVHGSRDHYMKFQINVQKDGKMLEFSNKQTVVESLMDHISEVEGEAMTRMLIFLFFGVIGFLTGFMDTCLCIGNRKRKQMISRLEENEGFYG